MVFTMAFGFYVPAGDAAIVTLRVGVNTTPGIPFPASMDDQASAEVAAATAADVHIRFASSAAQFAAGDTVTIIASSPVAITNACATPTTDADLDGVVDGSAAAVGNQYTYTFSAGTTAALASVDFCLRVAGLTAANYSFLMGSSIAAGGGANNDYGGSLLYVGDANDMVITAQVEAAELEFRIRNNVDTADQNSCDLGTLTTGQVSTCNYRLKVRTTATNGYSMSWTSDGDLDTAGGATIASIGVSTAVTAGTEGYGVEFFPGANTDGGTCTAQNIWAAAPDDPVSTTPTSLVACTKANLPAGSGALLYTHTMDHKAAIDAATVAGFYNQTVTYYVTANF